MDTNLNKTQSNIKQPQNNSNLSNNLHKIQNNANFISNILCFHHLRAVFHYFKSGITKQTILSYNQEYDKFLSTTRLKQIVMQNQDINIQNFQIFKTLLTIQSGSVIIVLVLCLINTASSILTNYYQQTLIQNIINQSSHLQWTYFSIIVSLVVLRFLTTNYLITLAHNIAINIRIHIQNMYMRLIFLIQGSQFQVSVGRLKFINIESIVQAIIFFPYMFVSFFTIIGLIVLVFILNTTYGYIFLGLFLGCFILMIILFIAVYYRCKQRQAQKSQMVKKTKHAFKSLGRLYLQNMTEKTLDILKKYRQYSISSDTFINRSYGITQFLGDLCIVLPIVINYILTQKNNGISLPTTYLVAVYLGLAYFPMKIFIYGAFQLIKGIQNYQSLRKEFFNLQRRKMRTLMNKQQQHHNYHGFAQNLGCCFQYNYQKTTLSLRRGQSLNIQIIPSSSPLYNLRNYKIIVIYSDIESQIKMQQFLKKTVSSLVQLQNRKICLINNSYFLSPSSITENIIFENKYEQQKFKKILKIVQLDQYFQQLIKKKNQKMNVYLAELYREHQSRIQLARALYNEVDYLIIDRTALINDQKLMKNILQYRLQRHQVTIVINRTQKYLFQISDNVILFLNKQKEPIYGSYQQLSKNIQLPLHKFKTFNSNNWKQNTKITYQRQNFLELNKVNIKDITFNRDGILFYPSIVHKSAPFILFIAIVAAPCLKFYLSYMISQGLKQNIYPNYFIIGLVFTFLVFLRGAIFTQLLRLASIQLFTRIWQPLKKLNLSSIIKLYQNRNQNIQADVRKLDQDMFQNCQLTFTLILQSIISVIIMAVGKPLYLAVSIPLIIVSMALNIIYTNMIRKIQELRNDNRQDLRSFVHFCTSRHYMLLKYKKTKQMIQKFQILNKEDIIYTLNQFWILSGLRMIGEVLFIIGFIIYLILVIVIYENDKSNQGFVSLGVSMFLSLTSSFRFSMKMIHVIQSQAVSASKCMSIVKTHQQYQQQSKAGYKQTKVNQPTQKQIKSTNQLIINTQKQLAQQRNIMISQFESIEYNKYCIKIGQINLDNLNFKFKAGQRIAISYDSRLLISLALYSLRSNIISKDYISGNVIINNKYNKDSQIQGIFYIHSNPLIPFSGSFLQIVKILLPAITKEQLQNMLTQFFNQLKLQKLFDSESNVSELPLAYKQIIKIFRMVYLCKCNILVLISAFSNLDIFTRIKIQKYLIEKSKIPLIISVTNITCISNLYSRKMKFRNRILTQIQQNKNN